MIENTTSLVFKFRLGWLRKCPVLQVTSSMAVLTFGFANCRLLKMSHNQMRYQVRKVVIGHVTCSGRRLRPLQVTQHITTFLTTKSET